MKGEFSDFVDARLESCCEHLRGEDREYYDKFMRIRTLREQLNHLTMSESDMAILQDFLQLQFEMSAVEQPAMYRLGMADGIQLLLLLGIL